MVAACGGPGSAVAVDAAIVRDHEATFDTTAPVDAAPCDDDDGDGLSDEVEGRAAGRDTDGDGTPDYRDTDSDDDGFLDAEEARRRYPGFASPTRGALACGRIGDNCDVVAPDLEPNHRDLDSDNDGLDDREESAARTDPCSLDTDDDGASDYVEVVAGSDPRDAANRPPVGTLYVVLPYHPPSMKGAHEHPEVTLAPRLVGPSRQDLTARVVADSRSVGLPAGRATSDFVRSVAPLRATPDAPDGYIRHDATTFYGVAPATALTFSVDLDNDFMAGDRMTARLFRVTIEVVGRDGNAVDARPIFVVVPAARAQDL